MNARPQTPELTKHLRSIEAGNRLDREWMADERFDALIEMSDRAMSLWLSIREAAYRRERATLEIHCPQIRALTLGAFETVKALPPVASEGSAG
jgi:hypothetical protein